MIIEKIELTGANADEDLSSAVEFINEILGNKEKYPDAYKRITKILNRFMAANERIGLVEKQLKIHGLDPN